MLSAMFYLISLLYTLSLFSALGSGYPYTQEDVSFQFALNTLSTGLQVRSALQPHGRRESPSKTVGPIFGQAIEALNKTKTQSDTPTIEITNLEITPTVVAPTNTLRDAFISGHQDTLPFRLGEHGRRLDSGSVITRSSPSMQRSDVSCSEKMIIMSMVTTNVKNLNSWSETTPSKDEKQAQFSLEPSKTLEVLFSKRSQFYINHPYQEHPSYVSTDEAKLRFCPTKITIYLDPHRISLATPPDIESSDKGKDLVCYSKGNNAEHLSELMHVEVYISTKAKNYDIYKIVQSSSAYSYILEGPICTHLGSAPASMANMVNIGLAAHPKITNSIAGYISPSNKKAKLCCCHEQHSSQFHTAMPLPKVERSNHQASFPTTKTSFHPAELKMKINAHLTNSVSGEDITIDFANTSHVVRALRDSLEKIATSSTEIHVASPIGAYIRDFWDSSPETLTLYGRSMVKRSVPAITKIDQMNARLLSSVPTAFEMIGSRSGLPASQKISPTTYQKINTATSIACSNSTWAVALCFIILFPLVFPVVMMEVFIRHIWFRRIPSDIREKLLVDTRYRPYQRICSTFAVSLVCVLVGVLIACFMRNGVCEDLKTCNKALQS